MKRFALSALALASCHGACGGGNGAGNGAIDASSDASSVALADAAAQLAPARCKSSSSPVTLGAPVDVGEAIATSDAYAIGVLREKNVFSVAFAPLNLSKITFADIGPARGEATPPQPFWWDNSVYVAWVDSGALRIGRVADGKVALVIDEPIDLLAYSAKAPTSDIPAFDVIVSGDHGIVVWDYASPAGGTIRRLAFSKSGVQKVDGGATFADISPPASDADTPRLAPRKSGGFWAIWVARKPESTADTSAIEGPGESPTYRWLEAAPLDDHGNRVGDVVRLTPTSGHVAGYDILKSDDVAQVVVRDATESLDDGTTVSRIVLGDKPAAAEFVTSEIGRAVPDVFGATTNAGSLAWIVVPDRNDATRIVPLAGPSARLEPASVEPSLNNGRALALRWTDAGGQLLVLRANAAQTASAPGNGTGSAAETAEISLVSCGR